MLDRRSMSLERTQASPVGRSLLLLQQAKLAKRDDLSKPDHFL